MKRESLLRHLRLHGCYLKREGGAHSLWCNPKTGQRKLFPGIAKLQTFLRARFVAVILYPRLDGRGAKDI
jgi:mRNA interferase HicA